MTTGYQPGYAERPLEDIWQDVTGSMTACARPVTPAIESSPWALRGTATACMRSTTGKQPVIGIQSIDSRSDALVREFEAKLFINAHSNPLGRRCRSD